MKNFILLGLILVSVKISAQCQQPDYLVAQPTAVNTIGLSWNSNTGISPQLTEVEVYNLEFEGEPTYTFTTTENPYTMTGVAGTFYGFRVRNLCSDGTSSLWSNYASVIPGCEKIAPYYENFDTDEQNAEGNYAGCWRYVTSGEFSEWGPGFAGNDGLSSQPNVFMMTEGEMLISPILLDMDSNKKMRFYLRTDGFTDDSSVIPSPMIVGTMTVRADPSTFVPYQTVFTEDSPNGREVEIDFSGYTGDAKYIAIKHPVTAIQATYSYTDDIMYFNADSCPPPFNVSITENTDTTATIAWEGQDGVESYRIEYGPHGFTPGAGTIVTGTGVEKQITGLSSGTSYDYYITSACGSGFSDIVVGPRTFATPCPATSLPWIEKFNTMEQYGINVMPDCFRLYQGSVNMHNQSITYNNPIGTITGTDDNTFLGTSGMLNPIIFTPTFNFDAGTTYTLSVKTRVIPYASCGFSCNVGRGNKYYNMNVEFPRFSTDNISWSQYNNISYVFTPVVSGTYSYMFNIHDSNNALFLDNFELSEGYTSVIDSDDILFDFEGNLPPSIILEGTSLVNPMLYGYVFMPAPESDNSWVIAGSGRSPLTSSASNIWEANENFITKINTKVDASDMQELYMSFDLLQTFNDVSSESRFRVIVNGEVLGDEIMPQTQSGDEYQIHEFDLTPYVGGDIRISLQHIGRGRNEDEGTSDSASVDNLRFSDHSVLGSAGPDSLANSMIYPNPVKNVLTFQNLPTGSEIQIVTLSGQVIAREKTENTVSQINMANYAAGMYFVKISNGKDQKTYKVVKQ